MKPEPQSWVLLLAAMGFLSITVTDHTSRKVVFSRRFDRFPVRIGRHPDNDVHLDYPFIPRWHAEVHADPTGLVSLCALSDRNCLILGTTPLGVGTSAPITGSLLATMNTLELRFTLEIATTEPPSRPKKDSADDLPVIPLPAPAPGPAPRSDERVALPELQLQSNSAARRARLLAEVAALRPIHEKFDAARRAWEDACVRTLSKLRSADDRDPGDVRVVFREFPAADRPSAASDPADHFAGPGELGAVAHAASELLPGLQVPTGEAEIRRFLVRVVDILRVFAACGLELQRVRSRQSTELGVTWEIIPDPLAALETREDLLRYLLDWRDPGEARSEELVRSFAGIVDHLQCHVQAALAGAREVVFTLSPHEMERSVSASWPTRTAALWRHFETSFTALCGDTYDHLTPAFRAALARAYVQALARAGIPFQAHEPPAV